ncbi:DUF1501 domain-containing protein [Rivibacter subsaxonicus]|uniref:Uncharacterized protein (DUF1501 family) n=1 Tax=Rivibacter subsaxonicus TaxID=457575 RepID=A0A4V2FU94_9BURK|nr:DUF1501 domain-containing protein [Rivibacter subsaxonicus]RZU01096.1 uncharacterized protein (DUF1501 family) [Rivibacter subsaxonicus]
MKNKLSNASRREFLRHAGALSMVGSAAAPFALNLATLGSAAAQTSGTGDYRALVCLFLFGGNDAYNMVLPTDSASWSAYSTVRNQMPDPIALRTAGTAADTAAALGSPARLGGVLPINVLNNQGRSFAVHPLMSGVRDLFNSGRLAVLPNVGPLIRPTSKADYGNSSFAKPPKLFSHNDQQSTWQAFAPEGAVNGWGGRMADLLASNHGKSVFSAISASGNSVWLAGRDVLQYQVSSNGAIRIGGTGTTLFGSTVGFDKMRSIMSSSRSSHLLEQDHAGVVARSISAEAQLGASLPAAGGAPYGTAPATGNYSAGADPLLQYDNPLTGAKAFNSLAQQFQVVARTIGARGSLGVNRQVFFVSMGGFDTHDFQNRSQADLMARISHALAYFNGTLTAMGMANSVTTFTASDFGRTFTSNGDGTDHGWGSHHLVMGGAVKGGDLYGNFPQLGTADARGVFSSPNQIGNGAMLPETSVDQYAATLGRWFGLSDAQLLELLPNLVNFDASRRNLGFLA